MKIPAIIVLYTIAKLIITIPLYALDDYQFYAIIALGSNQQQFTVTIDSTEKWSWVDSIDCTGCYSNKYVCSASDTCYSTYDTIMLTFLYHQYFMANVTYDSLSVSNRTLNDFEFLQIIEKDYPSSYDGSLGFSILSFSENGLVKKLAEQNKIYSKCAGILLQYDIRNSSSIHLGGYLEKYEKMVTLWIPTISDDIWAFKIGSISYYGSASFNMSAVIGTAYSWIMMPYSIIHQIKNKISVSTECEIRYPFSISCAVDSLHDRSMFEDIIIKVEKETLIIRSSDYVTIIESNGKYTAYVQLFGWESNVIMLGSIFIKNYYLKLDADNMQIGLADIRQANKAMIVIVIGALSAILAAACIIILVLRAKSQRAL